MGLMSPCLGAMYMNRLTRTLTSLGLLTVLASSLSGCAELLIGGAVVGGVAAVDRRTFGTQTEDKAIMLKGENRVAQLVGNSGHVNVASFNRRVLLTGEVKDAAQRAAVEKEVRAIEAVLEVFNELEVAGVSSLTSRSSDALITTRVKANLVNHRELYANAFKVVTERGTVYLMGKVTQHEGNQAAEAARTVSGVQKIVKVLEYISDEELKKLLPVKNTAN